MRISSKAIGKPSRSMVVAATILVATVAAAQDRPSLNRSKPVSQHNTGRRFVSDVALALCARGDYESGIKNTRDGKRAIPACRRFR